jgi:hypothetical protein
LGRRMPEHVVREELGALGIGVQGIMQLRSRRRVRDPEKARPVTPHFIVTVARGPAVSKIRSITQLCGLRVSVETYTAPKWPLHCKRCQRFGHTQRNCGYGPRCVACGEAQNSGECSTPKEQLKWCGCGGNHTATYRGCCKWKDAKAALARRAPAGPVVRSGAISREVRTAAARPQLSPEQRSPVLRGGRVAKAQPAPAPKPNPTKFIEAPKKAPLTSTCKKARSKEPGRKVSAAPKKAPTTKASTKRCVTKPTPPKQLVLPPTAYPSPVEISDLLDTLPLDRELPSL